jgi:8-amino-7-oxononanoate synthase
MIDTFLNSELQKRKEKGLLRELKTPKGKIDFCSNDYLGFSKKNWEVKNSIHGATGSRLISGHSELFKEVESFISNFHNTEDSLIFNSGYNANLGFFSTIPQKGDTVIYDELCHASIRDGLQLGKARNFSFQHNSISDLEKKIQNATGNTFIVVESIYSMDGDQSPLKEISKLCNKHSVNLVVDEAHSTGIFGENGEGLCQELNIKTFARIHTFGKALGSHGAVIVCSSITKNYLINFCRSFIYTTALPPYSIHIILQSYKELHNNKEREILKENISLFKSLINNKNLIESNSPIQSIIIGGNKKTKKIAKTLQRFGFDIRPILSPTVAEGSERIRICLHSFNTEKEITLLCEKLNELL